MDQAFNLAEITNCVLSIDHILIISNSVLCTGLWTRRDTSQDFHLMRVGSGLLDKGGRPKNPRDIGLL